MTWLSETVVVLLLLAASAILSNSLAVPPRAGFNGLNSVPPTRRGFGNGGFGLAMISLMRSRSSSVESRRIQITDTKNASIIPIMFIPIISSNKSAEESCNSSFAIENKVTTITESVDVCLVEPNEPSASGATNTTIKPDESIFSSTSEGVEVISGSEETASVCAVEEVDTWPSSDETPANSANNISISEMREVVSNAKMLLASSFEDMQASGWTLVTNSSAFQLFKKSLEASHASEYMMLGTMKDISPLAFVISQIDPKFRALWDKSMKEISTPAIDLRQNGESLTPALFVS